MKKWRRTTVLGRFITIDRGSKMKTQIITSCFIMDLKRLYSLVLNSITAMEDVQTLISLNSKLNRKSLMYSYGFCFGPGSNPFDSVEVKLPKLTEKTNIEVVI